MIFFMVRKITAAIIKKITTAVYIDGFKVENFQSGKTITKEMPMQNAIIKKNFRIENKAEKNLFIFIYIKKQRAPFSQNPLN